jgi:hypothetical protein
VTTLEWERIRELVREVRELRRANEILRGASFFRSGARPETAEAVKFIAEHSKRWGVEPICRVLHVPPATYYAATSTPTLARELRDWELKPQIQPSLGGRWAANSQMSPAPFC